MTTCIAGPPVTRFSFALSLIQCVILILLLSQPARAQRRLRPVMSMVPTGDFAILLINVTNDTSYYLVDATYDQGELPDLSFLGVGAGYGDGLQNRYYQGYLAPGETGEIGVSILASGSPYPGFYRFNIFGFIDNPDPDDSGFPTFDTPDIVFSDPVLDFQIDSIEWMYRGRDRDSEHFTLTTPLSQLGAPIDPDLFVTASRNIDSGTYSTANIYGTGIADFSGNARITYINSFGAGQLNFAGNASTDYILTNDVSTATISGGTIAGDVIAYGDSQVNILGGVIEGEVSARNASTVNIGGNANINSLVAYGETEIVIDPDSPEYGSPGDFTYENSTVNITGGAIDTLTAVGDSVINLSGGTVGSLLLTDQSTLNIAGSSMSVSASDRYGYSAGFGDSTIYRLRDYTISGILEDGTAFNRTLTAGGDSSTFSNTLVSLRGIAADIAPDLYLTEDANVNAPYNNVVVGQSQDGTLNTSPTVVIGERALVKNATVLNDATLRVEGGTIYSLFANDISTLQVIGNGFAVDVGNVYGLIDSDVVYRVRDYSVQGTLADGTTFNRNLTGAAVGYDISSHLVALRGIGTDQAPDLFLTQDAVVNDIYNTVTVQGNRDGTVHVQIINPAFLRDTYVQNDATLDIEGGKIKKASVLSGSTMNISGGVVQRAQADEDGELNITGGTVEKIIGDGISTINVSGGVSSQAIVNAESWLTVDGGQIKTIEAYSDAFVTVSGGEVGNIFAFDSSIVEFAGGRIAEGNIDQVVGRHNSILLVSRTDYAATTYVVRDNSTLIVMGFTGFAYGYNNSSIEVHSGSIGSVSVNDNSFFSITDGNIFDFIANGDNTVNIEGGKIPSIELGGLSTIDMTAGEVNHMSVFGDCVATITGGHISGLVGSGNSIIHLYGGIIGQDTISLSGNCVLNLYGSDLTMALLGIGTDGNLTYTEYMLNGILRNGDALNGIHLRDYLGGFEIVDYRNPNGPTSPVNFLLASAPEPTTLLLILPGALAAVALLRRRI